MKTRTAELTDEAWRGLGFTCECAGRRCGHWEALYVRVREIQADARRAALEEAARAANDVLLLAQSDYGFKNPRGSEPYVSGLGNARVMVVDTIRLLAARKPEGGPRRNTVTWPSVSCDAPTCSECGSVRCRPLAGYVAPPGSPDGLFCPNCGERAVPEGGEGV